MSGSDVIYVMPLNASKCGSTVKVGGRTFLTATTPIRRSHERASAPLSAPRFLMTVCITELCCNG
jgi:hypothetical protein